MFTHVEQEKYLDGYKVWLAFNDGAEGEIDLSSELYGEIFQPLKVCLTSSHSPWKATLCHGAMAQILFLSSCVSKYAVFIGEKHMTEADGINILNVKE